MKVIGNENGNFAEPLSKPKSPTTTTPAPHFAATLKELMQVLKEVAPVGRILLQDLANILYKSASDASKHLPPQWKTLDKKQSILDEQY